MFLLGAPRSLRFCKGREDQPSPTEQKRIEKLRYLHRNRVNWGLAHKPEQWPWSSFRHRKYGERDGSESMIVT